MRIPHWLAAAIGLAAASASADVWMADDRLVHRLSPGTDAVELSVDSPRSKALAVDPKDGAVWILSDTRVARRSRLGAVVFDFDLKTLRMEDATYLSLDARGGSVWALRAGDQAGALALLTDGAKDRYARVFDVLRNDMGAVFDSVQSFRGVTLDESIAEFAVTRMIDGELNIFFIYFVKDGTGQWKLDSM